MLSASPTLSKRGKRGKFDLAQSEQKIRSVRRPLAGGGQDFEKLDQNLKFPQIVKRGDKRVKFT